jgi:hypothetical protein
MFRRLRIIANGSAVVEDIEQYGRVFQMFSMLLPGQQLFNNAAESWGVTNHVDTFTTPAEVDPLPGGSRRQLVVQLLSPFLNQGKWIPLSMLPITVEIELADADEAFVGTGTSRARDCWAMCASWTRPCRTPMRSTLWTVRASRCTCMASTA